VETVKILYGFIDRYVANHLENGVTTEGEVLHERPEGIEKLSALILQDLVLKTNSFR